MTEESKKSTEDLSPIKDTNEAINQKEIGPISKWLKTKKLENNPLDSDQLGIEIIEVKAKSLFQVISALKEKGFDYLACQGGYDEGAGKRLVSFYHLICMNEFIKNNNGIDNDSKLSEVRIKVFLDRKGELKLPSIYKLFKGADWQERETFDMYGIIFEGHPHPKRLLMPEDWKGWPLRKDYVQPDFYEMQDAY